jgi:hypothetical protein
MNSPAYCAAQPTIAPKREKINPTFANPHRAEPNFYALAGNRA